MRIGLLVLSVGNFGNKGFYNLQEVGLARELDRLFDEVLVYRLTEKNSKESVEAIAGCRNATLHLLPSRQLGSNGVPDLKKIDSSIDILVCFSDTQLLFPRVFHWCQKHGIPLIPYIGVSKSHSTNPIRQGIIDFLFTRNLRLYRRVTCLAKTPGVCRSLRDLGVRNIQVAPVGLDTGMLRRDYENASVEQLRSKHGYRPDEKIVLFIGRMTEEKQPGRMIRIFKNILEQDASFRLLMVGSGELSDSVQKLIGENGLEQSVRRLERVPNRDIWEFYRIADCFVNLNRQEIYGMVLLEAMYYGCKVIAWKAPGPCYIIRDRQTGYLTDSDEKTCELILDSPSVAEQSKAAVLSEFTWQKTSDIIFRLAREDSPLQ